MDKKLLNEQETAQYLNMSRSWLRQARCYQWSNAPPYLRLGRSIRYSIKDLDAWIESQAV